MALDLASVVTTHLTAGGLAARSVNILCQVCLPPSRLRAPVSPGVSTVSSRTLVNNAGLPWQKPLTPLTPCSATRGVKMHDAQCPSDSGRLQMQ